MSDSNDRRDDEKRDLECLRLASDCKSASHLTPYRLPTLTPPMACEVIASAQEISSWLGSRLGADRGQSSEPIHTLRPCLSFRYTQGAVRDQVGLTTCLQASGKV